MLFFISSPTHLSPLFFFFFLIFFFFFFFFLAEMVAKKYGVSREEMDDFSYASHKKAHDATVSGRFQREIVPVKGKKYLFLFLFFFSHFFFFFSFSYKLTFSFSKEGEEVVMEKDEGIRWPSNREKLGKLKTLGEGGRITAATSSQISDGGNRSHRFFFFFSYYYSILFDFISCQTTFLIKSFPPFFLSFPFL